MKITDRYDIPATVAETGERIMVNNPSGEWDDNPWGFYTQMWHFTEDHRVFHDDELIFDEEKSNEAGTPLLNASSIEE